MSLKFTTGEIVEFHGTLKGQRVISKGTALEPGETGNGIKYRVDTEFGVLTVKGRNIFAVHRITSTPNSENK